MRATGRVCHANDCLEDEENRQKVHPTQINLKLKCWLHLKWIYLTYRIRIEMISVYLSYLRHQAAYFKVNNMR